jgi:hypothetical protein
MVFSWIKVFVSVVLGLFLADGADVFSVDASDLRLWLSAGFVAVIPLVVNYINPNDTRYGIGAVPANDNVEVFDSEEYTGE